MTPRIKICGIRTSDDAQAAAAAGADYVGVILSPGYRRSRSVADAAQILDGIAVERVGVFVDAPVEAVLEATRRLQLSAIQLHGSESAELVARLRDEFGALQPAAALWKVVRVREPRSAMAALTAWAAHADAVVLDGWTPHVPGGAGVSFAWPEVAAHTITRSTRLIVAGGLTPGNVAAAIAALRPDVVDVSSGVEDDAGRKSPARMASFVEAARAAFGRTMEQHLG